MGRFDRLYMPALHGALVLSLAGLFFACPGSERRMETRDELRTLIERTLAVWNEGNLDAIDELYARDYVRHEVDIYEDREGVDALRQWAADLRGAYPDLTVVFDEMFLHDDGKVITRWTASGTNRGPRGEEPPTHRRMRISGVSVATVVDGRIAEEWVIYNQLAILKQLGLTTDLPDSD